ncbi:PAS domain S-box protein [Dyella monticola]|uniref:histidine kinase n=2 Tax=Dyella monticola TaxID=1927958 RepID=A0A370WYS5_9GAMM|nr:PAS domain S-box protein [Dyella monticola]
MALSAELAAMQALHELSIITAGSSNITKLLKAALDVTMALHGADFGNVQVYEPETHTLRIAVQCGFEPMFLDHFAQVDAGEPSACGLALAGRRRKIVSDIETDPDCMPCRDVARAAGYRAVQSTPLFSATGEPLGMLSTHFRAPRWFTESEQRQTDLIAHELARVIESTRAQAALRESEERLRSASEVGRLGLWDWNIATGEVYWSDEHFRMEGYAIGEVSPSYEAWAARIHPDDRASAEAAVYRAMEAKQEYVQEFRVIHPDGTIHWLQGRGRFSYDDEGRPVRMIGANVDTTERREWEERQKVLIAELQHRTRNLMCVVRSMADKTARASADLSDFHLRFGDRLDALSRVQDLLSRLNDINRVTFDDLIRNEIQAMEGGSGRVTLSGPTGVRLRSSTVQTLAMVLHELATNAVKYGALGQPQGHLAITWALEPVGPGKRPWLHIHWRETGVTMPPENAATRRKGQGRELIENALAYQFNAKTSYVFGADGVACSISIPVSNSTLFSEVGTA